MIISEKNKKKIHKLYYFCWLYTCHRDFDLTRNLAKLEPSSYKEAEKTSALMNQLVVTRKSTPKEFIIENNESADMVIKQYKKLNECLKDISSKFGAKYKNELYKSVKKFYRKKNYSYQMDSYFTFLINGLFFYINNEISFDFLEEFYCTERCLFTGKEKPINLRKTIKMANYILEFVK